MALKTKVKAGNITNLSDARYCAGMGVDWLGFPASGIDPKTFEEITQWVSGPQFLIEVSSAPFRAEEYGTPLLQVPFARIEEFNNHPLVVELPLGKWNDAKPTLIALKNRIQVLLITDWKNHVDELPTLLNEITHYFPVLLNYEANRLSLQSILGLPISGINISGKQELKPGLQDFTALATVLEELEVD